jgi:hypothetical protein
LRLLREAAVDEDPRAEPKLLAQRRRARDAGLRSDLDRGVGRQPLVGFEQRGDAALEGLRVRLGDEALGERPALPFCAGRLQPERWIWFGGDPVSTITVSAWSFE